MAFLVLKSFAIVTSRLRCSRPIPHLEDNPPRAGSIDSTIDDSYMMHIIAFYSSRADHDLIKRPHRSAKTDHSTDQVQELALGIRLLVLSMEHTGWLTVV